MNSARLLLPVLAAGFLSSIASAQAPSDAPPWWGVNDDVTVSLYWSFNGPTPFTPTATVVPTWYSPSVTQFNASPNLVVLPTLAGRTDVVALVGNGAPQTALLDLQVDNDPHLNWVKIFWLQFDAFDSASGDVAAQIEQDLAKYGRAIVEQYSDALPNGWQRVTISAQLIPQPDDEGVDWTFTEDLFGTVAIDDLFVSSRCVKPGPDSDGDALGTVGGFGTNLNGDCHGVAVTEGPGPTFTRRYWVSRRGATPGAFHEVVQHNQAGVPVATTPLTSTTVTAPKGPSDLTVARLGPATTPVDVVYVLVDRRPLLPVVLNALDTNGAPLPTLDVTLGPFPPPVSQDHYGLAFDPHGANGDGTFWVTDAAGNAYEFRATGPTAGTLIPASTVTNLPTGCAGLGYDAILGNFYGFSSTPRPSPNGPVAVNGFEWSGYDFAPTGVEFCGDLTLPSRGGIARGMDVYRRSGSPTSQLTIACVVEVPGLGHRVYEMAGPYRFGRSLFGRCGMRGGPPFLGSNTFQVTLEGVPTALFAMMTLGFSNTNHLGVPLPLNLAFAGMPESYLSVAPDITSPLVTPTATGEFRIPLAIPPAAALGYVPVFFQWLVLEPNVPGFIAATQAGKTVLYP